MGGAWTQLKEVYGQRRLRGYLLGAFLSNVGTWIQRVTVGWLAFQLTGTAAWVGIIVAAEVIPLIVISPITGSIIDRLGATRILTVGQVLAILQATALAVLAASSLLSIEALFLCCLATGLIEGINQPARLSIIPEVAGKPHLRAAISLNSFGFNLARFVGPAVGGVILATSGPPMAFLVNALSFLPLLLLLLRFSSGQAQGPTIEEREAPGILHCLRYLFSDPVLAPVFFVLVAQSLFLRSVVDQIPAIAGLWYSTAAGEVARMTSCVGLGALIGAIWTMTRGSAVALARAVLVMPVALSFVMALFALVGHNRIAGYGLLVLIGAGVVANAVCAQSVLQLTVRTGFRGRALSLYGITQKAVPALGAIALGHMFDRFGLRGPILASSLCAALASAAVWRSRRQIINHLRMSGGTFP